MLVPINHAAPMLLLLLAAFCAGSVNSVAGGGTLLTFPSLVAFGLPVLTANGTSTVALVPGSIGAMWAYRREFGKDHRLMAILALPSVIGGVFGAVVALRINDKAYASVVPWLILGATILFILNEPIGKWVRSRTKPALEAGELDTEIAAATTDSTLAIGGVFGTMAFQLIVAIYGGFFGAGIGILMLAALGFLGLTNIHQMNALKSAAAVCINLIAALTFIVGHRVDWPIALSMAVVATLGGMGGAKWAQKLGQKRVRQIVIFIGLAIFAWMFCKQFVRI